MFDDEPDEEREADRFAGYFLMPDEEFKKALERCKGMHWFDAILTVKRYFRVSYLTVIRRLLDLGMTDNTIYQKFNTEYLRRYNVSLKNHQEPVALREPDTSSNNILVEERLHSLVREAVEKDIITISRAAEILNISHHDMNTLANSWKEINWKLN
jgi:Zn-dependent peptidase ImmA (M78 family)